MDHLLAVAQNMTRLRHKAIVRGVYVAVGIVVSNFADTNFVVCIIMNFVMRM
jgi:hypothetical protein